MTEDKFIKAALAFVEMADIKVGSKLKLVKVLDGWEYGWPNSWTCNMFQLDDIGKVFTVSKITSRGELNFVESSYGYPFFAFEVVEKEIPEPIYINNEDSYKAKFKGNGDITVGCQDITFEKLEEIYNTAKKVKEQ